MISSSLKLTGMSEGGGVKSSTVIKKKALYSILSIFNKFTKLLSSLFKLSGNVA